MVERLQRSELEVLRNEQLAAVGQLAAGIAHELRNPLMPIKMLVQAALERNDGEGLCGRRLEVVAEEIERLERSIAAFLDFARPVTPHKTVFDIVPVVEQALELVAARSRKQNVRICEELPDSAVTITADSSQIRQVLVNLLLNALDAMPEGGTVTVTVGQTSYNHPAPLPPDDRRCEIRIADSGRGVDPGALDRIFEPFVTTKETGTGLGLSICRRIIVAHGGEITARNLVPHGAEFEIRLPCLNSADGSLPCAVPLKVI
jgi:two-component system, NtrC family, sensor histidine kinase HydH